MYILILEIHGCEFYEYIKATGNYVLHFISKVYFVR